MSDSYLLPKANIKVYVRPLPRSDEDYECIKVLDDKKTILAKCLQDFSLVHSKQEFYWKYEVDEVFYNSNQMEVFTVMSGDCIKDAIEGNNTVFIGYGQTESGKSFTLNGLYHNYQQRGIGPRIMSSMLETKKKLEDEFSIEIGMSYCEIRGNEFYDLLNANVTRKPSTIKNNKFENLDLYVVTNEDQALGLLFEGEGRRLINKKSKYIHSHLCCSILTYYIVSTSLKRSFPIQKLAKIQIVDLAGVDKVGNISCFGKTNLDIGVANKDLTFLQMFLTCLNTTKHKDISTQVMHRVSLLVNYLSETLDGKSFLRFICNIKTNKEYHPITLSMLRITQIIKGIEPKKLEPHTRFQPESHIMMLEEHLDLCKKEALRNATFCDEELEKYMCKSRWEHLKRMTDDYLNRTISDMNILSSSHVKSVLQMMRDKYDQLNNEFNTVAQREYERGVNDGRLGQNVDSAVSVPLIKGKKKGGSKSSIKSAAIRSIPDSPPSTQAGDLFTGELNRLYGKGMGPGISGKSDTPMIRAAKQTADSKIGSKQKITEPFPQVQEINREEVWAQFITLEIFLTLTEKLALEQNRKETLKSEYNIEVQNLNIHRNELDKAKQVLRQAQMQRALNKRDEYSEDGLVIPTEEEKQCLNTMFDAKTILRQQIDVVTVLQSDLKLVDEEILKIQNEIENQFQIYCQEHFNTFIPELTMPVDNSVDKLDVVSKNSSEENKNEVVTAPIENEHEKKFRNQQRLMEKITRNKELNEFNKNRKWITDYKH